MKRPVCDPEERFWRHVDKAGDCWLWTKAVDSRGYGRFGLKGANAGGWVLAHRYAFQLTRGPIPDGMHVCHTCDVRNCVNPDHLFLGTALDNMRDMIAKGRQRFTGIKAAQEAAAAWRLARTHCQRGHEFSAVNTYIDPKGKRNCRTCRAASKRRSLERRAS